MISCREVTELVSRSMDQELPWRQRLSLRLHLAMCSLCRGFQAQVRFLHEACTRYGNTGRDLPAGAAPPRGDDKPG